MAWKGALALESTAALVAEAEAVVLLASG